MEEGENVKRIFETFTDEEFSILRAAKGDQTWHEFIIGQLTQEQKEFADNKMKSNAAADGWIKEKAIERLNIRRQERALELAKLGAEYELAMQAKDFEKGADLLKKIKDLKAEGPK